jgi:DNA invertase Pin-like site-specific DNA recombinase
MIKAVLIGVQDFECALIQGRVKAGIRNAKAKGKRIGRPHRTIDSVKTLDLRSKGLMARNCQSNDSI